ncbi:Mu transposase C-terminal domain-containing protein [Endozoicomonas euniceicola]|uniref:Mu transposase C-terminal domain-containing protein n=1 Tax=Endozoicomonas euniceicola TaxID=1234143 RepID=A0ABY6GU20_9GAMM|nr:Mu transposase C-terminal domain-containing protein [Endozoicomonas euniceicola]UYM16285.1 Mu transposase C-terminal domain-containing protein [Endozoicomonas euniceicola]
MQLFNNMVFRCNRESFDTLQDFGCLLAEDKDVFFRLLWVCSCSDACYLIELADGAGMPFEGSQRLILENIKTKNIEVVDDRFIVNPHLFSDKQRLKQKEFNNLLLDFLRNEPDCYLRNVRGAYIAKIVKEYNVRYDTIYQCIKRYWQFGKKPAAMAPQYNRRGRAKAEQKNTTDNEASDTVHIVPVPKKRGPAGSKHRKGISAVPHYDTFELILDTDPLAKRPRKLKQLYKKMLRTYFPGLPPEEVVSYKQFLNYKNTKYSPARYLRRILGGREFNKQCRPLTKDFLQNIPGPGHQFEIDATIADIFIVGIMFRGRLHLISEAIEKGNYEESENLSSELSLMVIGRPVIYAMVDTYSRLIVGLYIGLEGPNWSSASMALDSGMSNMRTLLDLYNISESELPLPEGMSIEDVFPCAGIPEKILADNESFSNKNIPQGLLDLGIQVEVAPVLRPDLKPVIERTFGLIQHYVEPYIPGKPLKPAEERVLKDPRRKACLTMREYVIMVLSRVIQLNTQTRQHYPLTQQMVAENVKPIPVELWHWGIENKTGRLSRPSLDLFRQSILYRKEINNTRHGLHFYGDLYYSCESGDSAGWFIKSAFKRKHQICYDPRNMNKIYLLHNDGSYETCYMTARSERLYKDLSLAEIEHIYRYIDRDNELSNYWQNMVDETEQTIQNLVKQAKKRAKGKPIITTDIKNQKVDALTQERMNATLALTDEKNSISDKPSKSVDTVAESDSSNASEKSINDRFRGVFGNFTDE